MPRNLNFSVESYGISTYSLRIKWEAPNEYEGAEISNYTLTVRLLGMTNDSVAAFQTKRFSVTTSFVYNHLYELSIAAENCNGISENVSIFIKKGKAIICHAYIILGLYVGVY